MGHVVNSDREYRLLQQRLDRTITGAPASPVRDRIVRVLYRPDDVDLAVQIPFRITPLPKLAKKTGIPEDDLCKRLTEMAGRGLMLDFEYRDEHYFALPPLILGFFEFTFMRARDELPMAELAALFEEYMRGDDRLAKSVYQHETQIGRALVQEEALPEEDVAEVLDWERASEIVDSADTVAVSRCACRHKKVIPPDTLFDRYVAMAIERGKLADLIFDDYQRLDHRALRRILGVLERTPVWRAALAVKPLKSALLNMTIWSAKLATRPFSDVMT